MTDMRERLARSKRDVKFLEAENERLSQRLTDWEPWMAALGRLEIKYKITRFPDDVERAFEELTNVRAALDNEYLEPVDKLVAIRCALGAQPADWQAIQKQVQDTAKKAREASSLD